MVGLNKVVIRILTKIIKDSSKIELSVEDLIKKFKDTCPPKDKLLDLISQKNQLQLGLQQVVNKLTPLTTITNGADAAITIAQTGLAIFKAIPSPPFAPTGLLADSIDKLSDLLKMAKGTVNLIPKIAETVIAVSNGVIAKLQRLETLLSKCVEDLSEGMTPEEKNNLIKDINTAAIIEGNEDEKLNDPYYYQKTGFPTADWQIIVEYDQSNEFSFPSRRVKAVNINDDESNVYRKVIVYNDNKDYSYSSSVKVLIEEIKFTIESLRR
jgi:hypothetical protein